jgi:hypothetical protein
MASYRRVPYRPQVEEWLRTPEAGRRLGIRTREVFELVDRGLLRIAVDDKGRGWVPTADVEAYRKRRSA